MINKYNLFLDEAGLIGCKGRLANVNAFSDTIKFPILLGRHCVGELLIKQNHFRIEHMCMEATVRALRNEGFLMFSARTQNCRFIANGLIGNKYHSRAGRSTGVPSFPASRVNYSKPCQSVGIDFTGHFFVKDNEIKK